MKWLKNDAQYGETEFTTPISLSAGGLALGKGDAPGEPPAASANSSA
ncbi:MAG: hypothetical protein M3126_07780 [Candidatus Eremiobacteraeota bacterium]|nr:hypothetical protein [Candidatus Eremiobacteraeota bacterium]